MKRSILLSFSTLLLAGGLHAQQFLNGSFEPKATIVPCHSVTKATYNLNMGNNWATGANDTGVYFVDNTCGAGTAVHGANFIGLTWTPMGGGNYIVFKLDAPLVVGTKYKFTFSYKTGLGTPLTLLMGYTHDSTTHDMYVHGIAPPTSANWTMVTDSLTPTMPGDYIWIAGSSAGSPGSIFVDNFKMLGVPTLGVNEVNNPAQAAIYPNPITNTSTISLSDNIALPCKMEMYDLSGRLVMQQQNITSKSIPLNKGDLNTGLYFIKIQDNNKNTFSLKASVQ